MGNFNEENIEKNENLIVGRNCVLEALKSGRELDRIITSNNSGHGIISVILAKAKEKGIPVKQVNVKKLDFICGGAVHQGIAAFASAKQYALLDDIFDLAKSRGEDPFVVVLDEIEDPHNLGAIIRTCECAGVHGVIIPKRRSSGLTYTVDKSSAGALEYVPVVRVTNISNVIETLKEKNLWVFALDMDGQQIYETDLKGGIAVVVGGEGRGIGRLVKEKCDAVVSLPMFGKINSLNASVSAGIFMYEVVRQRTAKNK